MKLIQKFLPYLLGLTLGFCVGIGIFIARRFKMFLHAFGIRERKIIMKVISEKVIKVTTNKDGDLVKIKSRTINMVYDTGESAIEDYIENASDQELNNLLDANEMAEKFEICSMIQSELKKRNSLWII